MKQLKASFNPLPKRSYDLNIYSSYPCYVINKRREQTPTWHCFIAFSDETKRVIVELLSKQKDCECYCKQVFENDLHEEETSNVW